ncbi:MAG: hypothetical protein SGARI_003990 [Bacillariaceae sp.]
MRDGLKENALIASGNLTFIRENRKFRFYAAPRLGFESDENVASAAASSCWYRHMTKEQYTHLRETNQVDMVDSKAYVAITNDWTYTYKYFSGLKRNGHIVTHIVEFLVLDGLDLDACFQEVCKKELRLEKVQPKIEDGAFSWGLGPQCRKGVMGMEFNRLLSEGKIQWRLVNYRQLKRMKAQTERK